MSSEVASADPPAAPPAAGEAVRFFLMDGTRANIGSRKISPHDFHNPGVLAQADLKNIDVLYQRYIRQLGARLSTFLRMECALKISKLTSSPFAKFCEAMAAPSCVTLFGIEQLRGVGILDMGLSLALAMADRLLGGKGRAPAAERPLTEIEMALLEDAMQLILGGWAECWATGEWQLTPRIIGHETTGRGLQTAAADEVFVVLIVEMSVGETTGQFQVAIPFSMVALTVRKMGEAQNHAGEEKSAKPVQWRKSYAGIAVPILAEWKVREMPLAETLRISKGDIIELPHALIGMARLRLSEVETFTGTVGIQNGHVAVQITGHSNKD